jgi:hypothetical protein
VRFVFATPLRNLDIETRLALEDEHQIADPVSTNASVR